MKKLAIIADIHGNALALDAVLREIQGRQIFRLVNLGDIFYGPLDPLATYKLLQQTAVEATIAGNQDRKIFEATADDLATNETLAFVHSNLGAEPIAWLRSLPATAVIDDDILLCHGTPASDTTYLLEDVSSGYPKVRSDALIRQLLGGVSRQVVLCGHSHVPRAVQISTGQLIVNPGSVGVPAYDDDLPVKHFMEAHSPHASYAILEKKPSGWNIELHRVAYEWNAAAMQAKALKREDWAKGIATGRMG